MKTVKTSKPRRRVPRQSAGLFDELVMDYFAGGGGASLGIERALGRAVDVAINHDPHAIRMHTANHPHTKHLCESVWKADLLAASGGRRVGLAWFSPDCSHFARARGRKPVKKKIRGLAWVVVKAAKLQRPRVILLENVREFEDWGPVEHVCGTIPTAHEVLTSVLTGRDLAKFKRGFKYDKFGEPVMMPIRGREGETFRRFVRELRSLGYAVEWRVLNAADYGAGTNRRRLFMVARRDGLPIRWPAPTHGPKGRLPYRTVAEFIDWSLPVRSIFDEGRDLVENTMWRIAMGTKRYVLEAERPFIAPGFYAHNGSFIVQVQHGGREFRGQAIDRPLGTITGKHGYGLVVPTLVQTGYGERAGQAARVPGIDKPLGSVVCTQKHALVAAFLMRICQTGSRGMNANDVRAPLNTVTSKNEHCLAAAHLVRFNHGDKQWGTVEAPLGTITAQGLKFGLVYSFLIKYFGTGAIGMPVDGPLHTVTGKARFGLVYVYVEGVPYVIGDIGMRMLTARELARCQGFPDEYLLTGSQANQVERIGNSVSPQPAEALVRANVVEG